MPPRHGRALGGGDAPRWGLSFAVAAGLHGLPLAILIWWPRPAIVTPSAPPPSVMVDMAPMPAVRRAPAPRASPRPERQRAATLAPPPPIDRPRLPVVADAAVSLPTAREAPPPDKAPAPQIVAPPAPPARATSNTPPASSDAAPTWQGLVLGRLERFKRYPSSAQAHGEQGVAYLRFTMDRDGKVLSAGIDKSSGFDLLDVETLSLIRRAQPLPKPPPQVAGTTLELVVPIEFFISRRR